MLETQPLKRHFIGRQAELAWLERGSHLGNVMLLKGLRGVGKTALANQWLQLQKINALWINLENYHSLPHSLGFPQLSTELALESAAKQWGEYSIIVWRDLHLLPPPQRQILLSFICRRSSAPLHLFLSEEEIPEAERTEISQLKIAALSKDESKAFLQIFDPDLTQAQLDTIYQASGGLPLLLRLSAQNSSYNPKDALAGKILQDLPEEWKNILFQLAVYNHAVAEKDISYLPSSIKAWHELNRKCLLDALPGEEAIYKLPAYVRNMVWNSMKIESRALNANIVLNWPITQNLPRIDQLRLSLIAQNPDNLDLNNNLAAELEQLHREDQMEIYQLLLDFPANALSIDQKLERERYLAKLQFLMGNRKEALLRAEKAAGEILKTKTWGIAAQNLILEYVQLLNRSGENAQARTLAQTTATSLKEDLQALLQVEQAVSWLPNEPNTAASILEKILHSSHLPLLAKANAHFQLGRALDLKLEYQKAKAEYSHALQIFTAQNRSYHALVCRLNIAWLCLKDRDWDALQFHKKSLHEAAHIFGYDYAIAGLEIIESAEAREFLQFNKALLKADSAIRRLGANAPAGNLFDAYAEKIRALIALNMRDLARSVVEQMFHIPHLKLKLGNRLDELRWFCQQGILPVEEWLEANQFTSKDYWQDDLTIVRSHFQLVENKKMPNSPIFLLAELESELLSHLRGSDMELIWLTIRKMEKLLDNTTEPMLERVANLLIQAQLTAATLQKQSLLDRASLELQRYSGDQECKYPLLAWLDSIDGNPKDHPLWKKAIAFDRERWQQWRFIAKKDKAEWVVFSHAGKNEVATLDPDLDKVDLFLNAPLAELRWRGKNMQQLQRRHSLRHLLTCLLENCPEAVNKEDLAKTVWQEEYNPTTHDARIYTSIQRLRNLFKKMDCIQNWQGSYRWNPSISYSLIQKNSSQSGRETKLQNQILLALQNSAKSLSRSELVALTQAPEATVKRSLTQLLETGKIRRLGNGRSISYKLNT